MPYLAVLGGYSWLSAQGSPLKALVEPYDIR